jgi:hypothetical protein
MIMACLAIGLAGCGQPETPASKAVEPSPNPGLSGQPQALESQESPSAPQAPHEDRTAAEKQAVALVEQLGGTVTEDLNSPGKPIAKVSLRDRPVNDKGLKAVGELKSMEELDLGSCREITNDGLKPLAGLTQLKKLVLWNMSISGAAMEHLEGLNQLEVLNLALCNNLMDDGLAHLSRLTNLRELDLASVGGITDDGLASLKPLTRLRWLNLYNARITDAGLEHLHGLTELETLYLNGTPVTDDGVEKLKAAIPKLREVHR